MSPSSWKITCQYYNDSKDPCRYFIQGGLCELDWMFRCIEYEKRTQIRLSYSSFTRYVHCNRSFWYDRICGLELKTIPLPMLQGRIASEILSRLHSSEIKNFSPKDHTRSYFHQLQTEEEKSDLPLSALVAMAALFEVYIELGKAEEKGKTEYPFTLKLPDYPVIIGFIDNLVEPMNFAYEFKYTKSPDFYHKFNISDQISTYFLGVPNLQRITVRKIQVPQLKFGRNESLKSYYDRVVNDVRARPNHYWSDDHYWRTEFDLDSLLKKLQQIAKEIVMKLDLGIEGFYQDPRACFTPPPKCPYYSICDSGVISPDIYTKKEIGKEFKGDIITHFQELAGKEKEDVLHKEVPEAPYPLSGPGEGGESEKEDQLWKI